MNRFLIATCISIAFILFLIGMFGCGSDSPTGPDRPVEPDWPEDALALPDIDVSAYDSAFARYDWLKDSLNPVAARHKLVEELNAEDSVFGWAGLGSDSTTICIRFADGATAILMTDEMMFPSPDPGMREPDREDIKRMAAQAECARRVVRRLSQSVSCGEMLMPSSRRVNLVNMAGGTNPETHVFVDAIKDWLIGLGWDEDDIDITEREEYGDKSFLPDSMFNQRGYGIVLFVGHGGVWTGADGLEHYHLQCFLGGSYANGYSDYVAHERWDDYKHWFQVDHSLVQGGTYRLPDSVIVKEVYMRDDLFGAELNVDEGALVSFIACNSWQLSDEVTAAGAGSVFGWDGQTNAVNGPRSFRFLIANMAGDASMTDVEALDSLSAAGHGTSTGHHGEVTYYRATDIAGDFHLPGWGTIAADADSLPSGTDEVEVTIGYEACPEWDTTFTMETGETVEFDGLIPGEATMNVVARNSTSKTIGAGNYRINLKSGLNEVYVKTCEAELTLTMGDYPQEADGTVTHITYTLTYQDPTIDAVTGGFSPGVAAVLEELVPLPAVLTTSATGLGVVLGTSENSLDLQCDENSHEVCYGWLVFEAGDVIAGVTTITVTANGSGSATPATVSFGIDSTAHMFGFKAGDTVSLTAEFFDTHLVSQGTAGLCVPVVCGENPVEVGLTSYAILLEVDPKKVAPDDASVSTITATLLGWEEDDLTEPTGDPVSGKLVEFDASCGEFVGAASGISDAEGKVTVQLKSAESCNAEIHAFVMEDMAESRPAYVNFGRKMSFWITGDADAIEEATIQGAFDVSCVTMVFSFNGNQIAERNLGCNACWGAYFPQWAEPGNVVTLAFTRNDALYNCDTEASSFGPIYVHTVYEDDFIHQKAYQLSPGVDNLVGTVTLTIELDEIDYYRD